jgi:hypothetical protein
MEGMAVLNSQFSVVLIVLGAATLALDLYIFGGTMGMLMALISGAAIGFGLSGVVGP